MSALVLSEQIGAGFMGSRQRALGLRHELEDMLDRSARVTIDFSKASVTQSFVDELVGVLFYQHGSALLQRLSFHGCSEDTKAVIRLVIHERVKDYEARHHIEH